jgi:hypothetical protein
MISRASDVSLVQVCSIPYLCPWSMKQSEHYPELGLSL